MKNLLLSMTMLAAMSSPAFAYFSTTDKTEAVTIEPNESAFWIPSTGANKDSQVQFDSEPYYRANKIAQKLFLIPHFKLSGSGGTWTLASDYYVPAGRMIIVDRAQYNQEWTKDEKRGTSVKDESFPCQSKDGINITTEVSVVAEVHEEDSPRFLHTFGVNNPTGDRTDTNVIFTSVYYGKSLTQVMDGVGRTRVGIAVCKEIGARTFDQANNDINVIMDNVKTKITKDLGDAGITITDMGWAGTWSFDPDVQRAINDRYTGDKIAPVLSILQAKAVVDALEGWDHKLPAAVSLTLLPTDLINNVINAIKPAEAKK